jgi:predicted nucleic acid-binding protein
MAGRVLTDASPLIGLACVGGLNWLRALFGEVWMPPEVSAEVVGDRGFVGEQAIAEAITAGWLRVSEAAPSVPELPDLDEGEAACIRIALASKDPALLLMDERAGRAVAEENGLRVAGTAAVIGMAKMRGLIPSAREVFAQLHQSDFRISAEVINTVLEWVGEKQSRG